MTLTTNLMDLEIVGDNSQSTYWVENGTLRVAGLRSEFPDGLTGVRQVVAGENEFYGLALLENGSVSNLVTIFDRRYFYPPADLTNAVSLAAGGNHALPLRSDGTVTTWGPVISPNSILSVPRGLNDVVAVAASYVASFALKRDGSVRAWGDGAYGVLNIPARNDIVAIRAGFWFSIILLADGTVRVQGEAKYQPPAGLRDVIAIEAGHDQCYALKRDGTVASWPVAHDFSSLRAVERIYAGYNHFVAWTRAPMIWEHPRYQALAPGTLGRISVRAQCASEISYQWYRDETPIAGATSADYERVMSQEDSGFYWCRVSAGGYSLDSQRARVVIGPPLLTLPQTWTGPERGNALIEVAAMSAGPLTYRWFFGEQELPGQTNPHLMLSNLQMAQAGDYYVRVANIFGESVRGPARLTVVPTPYLDQAQPQTGSGGAPRERRSPSDIRTNFYGWDGWAAG